MKIPETLKSQIKIDSLARLKQRKIEQSSNLQLYDEVFEVGQKLQAGPIQARIERRTAVVLVDLMPNYNWAHPCQILLYDAQRGEHYRTLDAHFPPTVMEWQPAKVEEIYAPVKPFDTQKARLAGKIKGLGNIFTHAQAKRYAIFYSGNSYRRHLNDLEYLYRTLIDTYGFTPENIYTLNFDGTLSFLGSGSNIGNWPGDNTPYRLAGHINGAGTRQAMETALDTVASVIKPDDLLFIHTNDHGAGPGDDVDDYCLFSHKSGAEWDPYYVTDFVNKLKTLPQFDKLMVMMEQCRSGGFIDPILNNSPAKWTHVATAVKASDYSWGGLNFDMFAEDWIAAIAGRYEGGGGLIQPVDNDGDSRVSASEAFSYANAVNNQGDSPTAKDKPAGYGANIFLGLTENDPFLKKPIVDSDVSRLIRRPIPEAIKKESLTPQAAKKFRI